MEEQLQLIESQLYKSEMTFPFIRERLLAHGEIRAWYRLYRGGNEWAQKFFKEETVFLMDDALIWVRISEDGQMGIHSFKLSKMTKSDRQYKFPGKKIKNELVLAEVRLTLSTINEKEKPDFLLLKRPIAEENGDPEGFEKLANLLNI